MKNWFIYFVLFLGLFHSVEARSVVGDTLTIGISKMHARGYDTLWLRNLHPAIRFINMYPLGTDSAIAQLKHCDGLLITGGEDVQPGWYGKNKEVNKCGTFDPRRDTLEVVLIQNAMKMHMPLLAICRGEQILNVCNGGSLFTDIPTDIREPVKHNTDKKNPQFHAVHLDTHSRLYGIIQTTDGQVNSFHHQCVDQIAPGFSVAARAPDGVVEAIEINDPKAFVFGVQWHPERMDYTGAFSKNIGDAFIKESLAFQREN